MNETLQQFCHRILPIVQAGAEGKDIESKCLRDADDWGSHEARLFLHDYEYRVAQPKATPLPITPEMWAMIDLRYEWAYLNQRGHVYFCKQKIKWDGGGWDTFGQAAGHCESPLSIDTTGIIPELSLTKRPPSASEAIRKAIADDAKATKKLMGFHDDCADEPRPIFVNGVRVGSLNQFGEVTGGACDPESTRKEMDRLAEEWGKDSKEQAANHDNPFTANKFWDKVKTIMVKDDLSDKYFFLTTRTNTETGETSTIKLRA